MWIEGALGVATVKVALGGGKKEQKRKQNTPKNNLPPPPKKKEKKKANTIQLNYEIRTDKNKTRRQLAVHGIIPALSIARQKFL
jgi:hypothetical protein